MKQVLFYCLVLLLMGCKEDMTPTLVVEVLPVYPCTFVSNETFGCTPSLSISCQKPSGDSATLRCLIVGSWEWVWEGPSMRRRYDLTPQTTGIRKKMIFRKDGIVEHFKNDTLQLRSPYVILEAGLKLYGIKFKTDSCNDKAGEIGSFSRICNDSLFFDFAIASDGTGNQKWVKAK
jgi:hypothetical protein